MTSRTEQRHASHRLALRKFRSHQRAERERGQIDGRTRPDQRVEPGEQGIDQALQTVRAVRRTGQV